MMAGILLTCTPIVLGLIGYAKASRETEAAPKSDTLAPRGDRK